MNRKDDLLYKYYYITLSECYGKNLGFLRLDILNILHISTDWLKDTLYMCVYRYICVQVYMCIGIYK